MSVERLAATNGRLREGRLWRLLAIHHAPLVLAVLESVFTEDEAVLTVSVVTERVTRDLEALRAQGNGMEQTAQAYIADWLTQGWLTRRLPAGAHEEVLELTAEATAALRWLASMQRPRAAATESRLASVMQQVLRLAEETDANPATRLARLHAERDRIDAEIAQVQRGGVQTLPQDRALERAREIISQAEELTADFRNVRDAFDRLNKNLRQSLVEGASERNTVLQQLFDGVDIIEQSEPGRAFAAFWLLLTDVEQSHLLGEAIDAITSRDFSRGLEPRERQFLQTLTVLLLREGNTVHGVLQQFARGLKTFVKSREFREQRRITTLMREAHAAAMAARELVRPNEPVGFEFVQTSSRIRSVSQWALHDPQLQAPSSDMADGDSSVLTVEMVKSLVRDSEIDFRALSDNILALLVEHSQVSVAEVLERFPAEQGFGSVVGYVALGAKHAEVLESTQRVSWTGKDGVDRSARVPAIYFTRERAHELRRRGP